MKRFFIPMLLVIAMAVPALGANTVTPSVSYRDGIAILTITCIDDSTDGIASTQIVNGTDLPTLPSGYILKAETDPGTTAPDANYDIAINDARGADLFGGTLNNRSATATEEAEPLIPYNYFDGQAAYLVVTGQTVNDATFVIRVWLKPAKAQ